jgi:hypothetical protein
MRLGLKIPETVLVPYKNPVDHAKWAYTSAQYNQPFDLDAIAGDLGYPMYMKPFDGGGWRGVSRIENVDDLHRAYDESGEMLMHLQSAMPHDVFARALSIGPETMVMRFRPELPMHDRYEVRHDFLSPEAGEEAVTISQVVNAFFHWDFNSCEMLIAHDGPEIYPIDYANACPDVAVTSLHYYFPWAIKALVKWTTFCVVTDRPAQIDLNTADYYAIADRDDLTYAEKLAAYRTLANRHFDTEPYMDFCDSRLAHLDDVALEWFGGQDFDRLLVDTVATTYPQGEHEQFLAHVRGLVGMWVADETSRLS